jgi:hypothetical protein
VIAFIVSYDASDIWLVISVHTMSGRNSFCVLLDDVTFYHFRD